MYLSRVTANGQTTVFAYDGDGNRVKATFGGATTVYVGNHYEVKQHSAEVLLRQWEARGGVEEQHPLLPAL